jgi:hypothetical protein
LGAVWTKLSDSASIGFEQSEQMFVVTFGCESGLFEAVFESKKLGGSTASLAARPGPSSCLLRLAEKYLVNSGYISSALVSR